MTTSSLAAIAPALTTDRGIWDIDTTHASATFKVRHLMVSSVRGELGDIQGVVIADPDDLLFASVRAEIDVRRINTKNADRDAHLRSADFLDVANHPSIRFSSTRVEIEPDGSLLVTGELTIRGVTREITLAVDPVPAPVIDPWGNEKTGVTARAKLDRRDFGLTWNLALEAGGFVVGDEIAVEIELELVRRRQ